MCLDCEGKGPVLDHLQFAKQHRLLTFGTCLVFGIVVGYLLDNVLLVTLLGVVLASTWVFGEPRSS
jgi:hypothetical protein